MTTISSSITPPILFTPLWNHPGEHFHHTWQSIGNIDQFRWLARADAQNHLALARDEVGVRHVRAVAMYGPEQKVLARPLIAWNKKGGEATPRVNWQLVDLSIEQVLALGIKPIYTTCFTPKGFCDDEPACWPDRNPISMPRDLGQWADFVSSGIRHHLERFGAEEVRSWYFECWNEPNLNGFFAGTKEDFFRLWSSTWKAVKSVDPLLRFGGPSTARGEWIPEFLDWTTADGTPPDYLITHVYNNDSDASPLSPFDGPASHRVKDSPHFASGVIRGLRAELDRRQWKGEVHWNEWGRSWFPHDPRREGGLEAAFIVKTMAEVSQCADQFAFWCLSDIYDQIGFQSSEFEGHYGLLSLHGLRKPGWHAHTLLNRLGDIRLPVQGGTPLFDALVTRSGKEASALVYAYPQSTDQAPSEHTFRMSLPTGFNSCRITRLDHIHNNIIHTWNTLGAPAYPNKEQLARLQSENAHLAHFPDISIVGDHLETSITCPGLTLLELS